MLNGSGDAGRADDVSRMEPGLGFLAGGGEATRLVLARDWSDHPLGQPEAWPDALKTALSTILNSPESLILAWGAEAMTFFFNDAYAPLLGPRAAWAMGSPFKEVWTDAWEQARPIIEEAFAGRSTRYVDLPWRLATDRGAAETWWTFSYSRILGAAGGVAGLLVVTNETTERVLADRRAAEAEEQLGRAQEAGGVGLFWVGADGFIHPTPYFCSLYGVAPADAMPATVIEDLVVAEDRAKVSTRASRAAGLVPLDVEYRIRRADTGELRWIARTGRIERDHEGAFTRFTGAARDVTGQVATRQALEVLNATLEEQVAERTADRNSLWKLSSDIMLVSSLEGVIEAVNPAWTRTLGWTGGELIGQKLFDFVHPDDLEHTLAGAAGIARGEAYARFENRYRHKDGSYRDIVWAAGPGNGKVIGVGRDATEEKAAAAALAATEEQLRQSQKMEAVGQLTGGLAHDFNNLLTGITGSLELLGTRIGQGRLKDLDRYVGAAQGAAKRAAALTHRLLAFSRRQTLDPRPTDANRLVSGMEDLIRRTVGPAVAVEAVGAAGLWPVLVDPPQLENALLNLCINARDAMPGGGRLTVETANRWLDTRAGQERDLEPGQYVSLCVSDTGTGMTPDVIAKAFDPFFTTKPLGQGTGLGLSMIYGFVRQSGGQARIYSEPGQGTTVCLYLPRHLGAAETAEAVPNLAGAPRAGQGETVLVVDDEPTVRMLVTEVLEELGYAAVEAADGASGLRVLQSDARIDLVVTDVGLPGGMNGRQMADAARVGRPGLKVLFITGYAENAVVGNGYLAPGMHVMTKPFAMEALARRIRELTAGQAAPPGR